MMTSARCNGTCRSEKHDRRHTNYSIAPKCGRQSYAAVRSDRHRRKRPERCADRPFRTWRKPRTLRASTSPSNHADRTKSYREIRYPERQYRIAPRSFQLATTIGFHARREHVRATGDSTTNKRNEQLDQTANFDIARAVPKLPERVQK